MNIQSALRQLHDQEMMRATPAKEIHIGCDVWMELCAEATKSGTFEYDMSTDSFNGYAVTIDKVNKHRLELK